MTVQQEKKKLSPNMICMLVCQEKYTLGNIATEAISQAGVLNIFFAAGIGNTSFSDDPKFLLKL